jgi:hypothetical protein
MLLGSYDQALQPLPRNIIKAYDSAIVVLKTIPSGLQLDRQQLLLLQLEANLSFLSS